ncbi:MAG: CBS domain-containing protein [Thermoleophilia bacterium]
MNPDPGLPMQPLAELVRHVTPLREDETIADAAPRLAEEGGGLPVADAAGRLVGYLSERDMLTALFPAYLAEFRNTAFLTRDFRSLMRHAAEGAGHRVGDHMSREPACVELDDSESHTAELFIHNGLRTLAVVDADRRVVGLLRLGDLISALLEACRRQG